MDRNMSGAAGTGKSSVATREGGVDRNYSLISLIIISAVVATREGGVDRNSKAHISRFWSSGRHPRGWRG